MTMKSLGKHLQGFVKAATSVLYSRPVTGKMGLDYLHICEVVPNVCILDINMPIMDGFDTAKELSKKYPQIKILVFAAGMMRLALEKCSSQA